MRATSFRQSHQVDHIIRSGLDESGQEAVPLPGHFLDMTRSKPRTECFAADSVFCRGIEKYALMFVMDVKPPMKPWTSMPPEAAWLSAMPGS